MSNISVGTVPVDGHAICRNSDDQVWFLYIYGTLNLETAYLTPIFHQALHLNEHGHNEK